MLQGLVTVVVRRETSCPSLTEASELLGVHSTTLRRWTDWGNIPSFRTPGGHRRLRAADVASWAEGKQMRDTGRQLFGLAIQYMGRLCRRRGALVDHMDSTVLGTISRW